MFPRVQAHYSAKALLANYDSIREQVPAQSILPMIKANAYGHGAAWVARILDGMPGLYGFGVATLEEGREVRQALGSRGKRTRILVVSGTSLWSEEKGSFCERYGLTATISSQEDWAQFTRGRWHERIAYELKFNTGMNRLGLPVSFARVIAKALRNARPEAQPSGILSHLAIAEKPGDQLARLQKDAFSAIRAELAEVCPSAHFHLGNSSAIWNAKLWGLDRLTDVVRPGLSLYGIVPYPGAPARGLAPVLNLRAQIIERHRLKVGQRLGYGGTFRAKEPTEVAILAIGYADGLLRAIAGNGNGNGGHAVIDGKSCPFLGRINMDLCAVQCPKTAEIGGWAEILGSSVDPWKQAAAGGTVPYELLTSVGNRVERIYA